MILLCCILYFFSVRYKVTAFVSALINLCHLIMRPSSLGGGRILRRTLSVRLSVCLSVCPSVRPSRYCFCLLFYSRTVLRANIQNRKKFLFSLMGQRHVCTFRHAQRAAYRTAISAAQTCFIYNIIKTQQTRKCIVLKLSGYAAAFRPDVWGVWSHKWGVGVVGC